ncbi:MAG TPA: HIT domain-containing protein [Candidatus Omnitrophota bacterium]|jgi:ATP adenylyltransferase|nr:HIT domain-containing protein [Candidatus Omnitrophota bacterium]
MAQNKKQMDRLWAPWRKTYLRSTRVKSKGCLFCGLRRSKDDRKNLVVFRGKRFLLILNRYPYNNGHLLIVPKRHLACISQLDQEERQDFFTMLDLAQSALQTALKPHGFNIGMNVSDVAGAGIPEHLHWHIVPRWKGDVNFMPVIAGDKVISESLDSAFVVLRQAIQAQKGLKKL